MANNINKCAPPLMALVSRLLFALALYLPTVDALLQASVNTRLWQVAIWGALISLAPALLPRKLFLASLALVWIISPLVMGLLGYIALDGIPPSIENVSQTIHEADISESISAFQLALHARGFGWWVAIYFALLLTASILAGVYRSSEDKIKKLRNGVLCACIMSLAVGSLGNEFLKQSLPPWVLNHSEIRMTLAGNLYLIVLFEILDNTLGDAMYVTPIKDSKNLGGRHTQAHEKTHITAPTLSVLVIGESMRANALGPGTANRGIWSKELNERVKAGLAAWLPPTCAAHDSTSMSVPALITGTPPNRLTDGAAWTNSEAQTAPTGLSRLKSAGYDIGWVASGAQGVYAGPEITGGNAFLWYSPMDYYLSGETSSFDEELLPMASGFLNPMTVQGYQGKPKALVIHIFGSHFRYEDRYPKSLFDPEPDNLSREELQTLHYNRANEYGAKILTGVAQMLDRVKAPAYAVYISDHGENLISDHNGLLGHVGARTSLAADLVPVLVMWNEAARASGRPQRVLAEVTKASRLAQTDVYHVWMSLSGLEATATVHPTKTPLVFGALHVGDKFTAIPCSTLQP